ncbi:Wzz/FepE/Etk N-terminal domain-containing protein [uncultured Marinobacter sp.]|uniref:Wzz/FepE/Etk N-terminal domain-containing protein n=1 Tax=uncultured Marinobacter sp. TaxID=187379 RepID=UPI002615795D|nr:Wzz/FepE/Etk N-terminal domain-containing protein [uncultured Marinobacter sp.]
MSDIQHRTPDDQRQEYSDEVSLVDLVATFIRRRRVFYAVLVSTLLAGFAYALLAPNEYEHVSLIQIAQKDSETFFQSPETTIATLESRWLPEVQVAYRAEHDKELPFKVSFSNPDSTGLIRFTTTASKSASKAVTAAHSALIAGVEAYQATLVKKEQQSLERQVASLDSAVEALRGQPGTGEAIAGAIERQSKLEGKLKSFQGVEVLVISRQSAQSTAPKRSLIIALAILQGGMLGIFAAFMAEFAASVRKQLAKEGREHG